MGSRLLVQVSDLATWPWGYTISISVRYLMAYVHRLVLAVMLAMEDIVSSDVRPWLAAESDIINCLVRHLGYSSRGWGLTMDTIVGLDAVLADGRIIYASENSHSHIYWVSQQGSQANVA